MFHIRRIISVICALMIFGSMSGLGVYAAEAEEGSEADADPNEAASFEAGGFEIETESAGDFKYENGRLYIYGGTVSIKNRPEMETVSDRIEISGNASVVLSGVNIEAADGAAITVLPGAYAEIRLDSHDEKGSDDEQDESGESEDIIENFLCGSDGFAGIEVATLPGGEEMPVFSSNLCIKGNGYLTCAGGNGGAGIGGSRGQYACGIISIEEGNITAIAGPGADAIGCGADCEAGVTYLPQISEQVSYLLALADGEGTAITSEKTVSDESDDVPEDFDQAPILKAAFAVTGDNSLAGLKDIRVRSTTGEDEIKFDMPDGYRDFAVKTADTSDYMIEQGGVVFAASEDEEFSGEITEDDDICIVFTPQKDSRAGRTYLVPVSNAPAIDIDVISEWNDAEDKDGSRPESVVVTLYANGGETGRSITLSGENDWQGTFEDLPVYSDSTKQSYSIVEESIKGYTVTVCGSDCEGYKITNIHEPLPEGRKCEEEISRMPQEPVKKGVIVATVVTSKVTKSTPVRTSTTIKKTKSAKTSDTSNSSLWGFMLLFTAALLLVWMHFEQKRD